MSLLPTGMFRAQDVAAKAGHKTINGNHVLAALEQIGFADWAEPLRQRIEQYMAHKAKKPATGAAEEDDDDHEQGNQRPENIPDTTTTEMEEDLAQEPDHASDNGEDDEDDKKKRVKLDELLAIQDFDGDN